MARTARRRPAQPRRIRDTEQEPEAVVKAEALLPLVAIALRLYDQAENDLVYIAADERRADEIGRILARLAPDRDVLVFPPWDCLPFDRASPSRDSMGRRMAVLQHLAGPRRPPVTIITTVDASMQRTPPLARIAEAVFEATPGKPVDVEAFRAFAHRTGYVAVERVAEPGEWAFHGHMLEVFPPGAELPWRIDVEAGSVASIHVFDPLTQRSTDTGESALVRPASEMVCRAGEAAAHGNGAEHGLAAFYGDGPLPSLFDHLPDAVLLAAPDTGARRQAFLEQLEEAAAAQAAFGSARDHERRRPDWRRLYLDQGAWDAVLAHHEERDIADAAFGPAPNFTESKKPAHAFQTFVEEEVGRGRRVVLTGVPRDLSAFTRHLDRHGGRVPEPAADWADVLASPPGAFRSLDLDLEEGIDDTHHEVVVVAAADVLGTRVHHAALTHSGGGALTAHPALRIGDTVIHEDHGVGVLRALEQVDVKGSPRDAVRLDYHGGDTLLVPVEDLDRLWRYGSDVDAVTLDRLHTDAWSKRRIELQRAVLDTGRHLVALAEERLGRAAPRLTPPDKAWARFAARFPYPLTPDQTQAVAAVADDLAAGRPMDRLVCGDVGFGKTEVALRAAAAALMGGKQVALVAPTTVLARQHLATFRKRFQGFGFEIASLSRLDSSAEANRVKAGLADGSVHMVVGTHAVAGASIAFRDLGLLIIDEEQKFGSKLKGRLRSLAADGHVLTLTATPIPRTLQLALVGVQTVSVIATPPVRRRPIRTFVADYDPAAMRVALMREHARGGQSFVIVPRIDDIEPFRARLAEVVPELEVVIAHGELPAEDVDRAMVDFAHGQGDVLLATNIVESGLDVPRANTMLVWDAGRFGLGQLHQLRGRVGRGRMQGVAYLLTGPDGKIADGTRARLTTLQGLDRLGAGFAISLRDLDLRGAGDLVGDEQAGHLRLVGLELYQDLLARAVRTAKGDTLDDAPPPELQLDCGGRIPDDFVTEPDLRIELYQRISRLTTGKAVRALRAEIEDRFGPVPPDVEGLLARARLRIACRGLHVASLSVGPKAVAVTIRPEGHELCKAVAASRTDMTLKGPKLVWSGGQHRDDDLARADTFLDLLEGVNGAAAGPGR